MAVKDKPHGPVSEHFMRHYYGASKPAPTPHPDSHGHWDHAQISELLHERDALQAENLKLREACASGWGEPALINTLQAELAEARKLLRESAELAEPATGKVSGSPDTTFVIPAPPNYVDTPQPPVELAQAEARKDAERYRAYRAYFRDNDADLEIAHALALTDSDAEFDAIWDKEIDTALAKEKRR